MRKLPLLAVACILSFEGRSTAIQVASPINERAGMYSCRCADGRSAGPIHVSAAAIAWQQYDQALAQMSAVEAKQASCLADVTAGRRQSSGCSTIDSRKSAIKRQLDSAARQAGVAAALAPVQCAAACQSSAPRTPPRPSTSSSSTTSAKSGSLPVGNDWSLNNTIS